MPVIKIQRTNEYMYRIRDFRIYIDGQKIGTIANGQTKEFEVTAGTKKTFDFDRTIDNL